MTATQGVTPEFEAMIDALIEQPPPPPSAPTLDEIIADAEREEELRRKEQAELGYEPEPR